MAINVMYRQNNGGLVPDIMYGYTCMLSLTSSLPSCLWSLRVFPSLPGSRLTVFYRDASSALLQLVNQWFNFTYSRSHAFRYKRKIHKSYFGNNRTHDFRTSRCADYLLDHSGDESCMYVYMYIWSSHIAEYGSTG